MKEESRMMLSLAVGRVMGELPITGHHERSGKEVVYKRSAILENDSGRYRVEETTGRSAKDFAHYILLVVREDLIDKREISRASIEDGTVVEAFDSGRSLKDEAKISFAINLLCLCTYLNHVPEVV